MKCLCKTENAIANDEKVIELSRFDGDEQLNHNLAMKLKQQQQKKEITRREKQK